MSEQDFKLEDYLAGGIGRLVGNAIKATLRNPKQALFFVRFAKTGKRAARLRAASAERGEHVPPFLIASIATACNLHCAGCYARAHDACSDVPPEGEMASSEWARIFDESAALGIQFILLAGGEPMMRKDVLRAAASRRELIFPVFTNGTLLDAEMYALFAANRHMIPIVSIEGDALATDLRRGKGTHAKLMNTMTELQARGIFYGASVTVTKQNMHAVAGDAFLSGLRDRGCQLVFFIEYVPVTAETAPLAPDDADRAWMATRLAALRSRSDEMLYIAFPGDERVAGGCLAAGRGFFHINHAGDAEPCPFSPHSDTNMHGVSVREALRSPLFTNIRDHRLLLQEHVGGCVLFAQDERIKAMLPDRDDSAAAHPEGELR